MTAARRAAGEKLSESSASDVRQLCTTLLNCYLIQARTLYRPSRERATSWPAHAQPEMSARMTLAPHC